MSTTFSGYVKSFSGGTVWRSGTHKSGMEVGINTDMTLLTMTVKHLQGTNNDEVIVTRAPSQNFFRGQVDSEGDTLHYQHHGDMVCEVEVARFQIPRHLGTFKYESPIEYAAQMQAVTQACDAMRQTVEATITQRKREEAAKIALGPEEPPESIEPVRESLELGV